MSYRPTHFNKLAEDFILPKDEARGIDPYVFNEDIVIAVDVALATNRPLLISGNPGCGKSRLADAVAAVQEWNLLGKTITSRTRLEELTVEIDHLRRLNDAHSKAEDAKLRPDAFYQNPGIFWWAFHPSSARYRGMSSDQAKRYEVNLTFPGTRRGRVWQHPVVLLIDEIDKAEPDLPNDLLEPLDRRSFGLPDGGKIEGKPDLAILTLITTNGERELPQAFLRRCITLELPDPGKKQLIGIGQKHFPQGDSGRIEKIAQKMEQFRTKAREQRRRPPGTSEFLDAIRACEELGIDVDENDHDKKDSVWARIENAVLVKEPRRERG